MGGGRWSVNLGHPAAPAAEAPQLMKGGWRHSLITARWPRLLLQQRGGERKKRKIPITASKAAAACKQATGLSAPLHAMEHLARAFLESAPHSPVNVYMHPCVCMNMVRNGHDMPYLPNIHVHVQWQMTGFLGLVSVSWWCWLNLDMSWGSVHLQPHLYLMSNQNWRVTGTCLQQHWG